MRPRRRSRGKPGRDDRRRSKAVGLIGKALEQAGVRIAAEIVPQAELVFAGGTHASRYPVAKEYEAFPRLHALIRFSAPVSGPLAIGSGRHAGFGVLAVLPDNAFGE